MVDLGPLVSNARRKTCILDSEWTTGSVNVTSGAQLTCVRRQHPGNATDAGNRLDVTVGRVIRRCAVQESPHDEPALKVLVSAGAKDPPVDAECAGCIGNTAQKSGDCIILVQVQELVSVEERDPLG